MRIPTDTEINEAARRLALAVDGKCPPSLRGRVARSIQLATEEDDAASEAESAAAERDRAHTAGLDDICTTYRTLADRIGGPAASAVTAALAPALYRTAHERNRTHAPKQ